MPHQHLFILPRKEGKSGAVRHSHLLLPIVFHWKEVGPDRLVLVDTSRYKIRAFSWIAASLHSTSTYIHNINATQSVNQLNSLLFYHSPLYKISTLYNTRTTSPQTKEMAPITPLLRTVAQRRTLSVFTRVRSIAQTAELHPFSRLPHQKAAKADWGKQFRHVGDAAML